VFENYKFCEDSVKQSINNNTVAAGSITFVTKKVMKCQ
jgi:hypothetical protein